jgi:hypothetical protein
MPAVASSLIPAALHRLTRSDDVSGVATGPKRAGDLRAGSVVSACLGGVFAVGDVAKGRGRGDEQDRHKSVPHPTSSTRIRHYGEMF